MNKEYLGDSVYAAIENGMIPRFQGRLGKGDDNKYYFEIFCSILGQGEPQSVGTFGPWDTEEISTQEMMKAIQICCEQAGGEPGKYIDLKTNQTKEF